MLFLKLTFLAPVARKKKLRVLDETKKKEQRKEFRKKIHSDFPEITPFFFLHVIQRLKDGEQSESV